MQDRISLLPVKYAICIRLLGDLASEQSDDPQVPIGVSDPAR
jgi:hypothetical protein